MLLNLSIISILIFNIFFNDIKILALLFLILIFFNIFINKNIKAHLKSLKILFFFYLFSFLIQIIYNEEGKVLFKFFNFYITEQGLINFSTNFFRIFNLILISWLISERNIFKNKLGKYQKVIENVISLVPEVFVLFKKKIKIKVFLRHILNQIRLKYESDKT